MTDPTRPVIEHAPRCQRRRPPVLVAAWHRADAPLLACPECGRTAPAPDTRDPRPGRTHP